MSTTGSAESYIELRGSLSIPDAITGKSAYEIAVANGFEGTEAEWLESLTEQTAKNAEEVIEEANNAVELIANEKQKALDEISESSKAAAASAEVAKSEVQTAKTNALDDIVAAKTEAVNHIASLAEGAYDIVQTTGDSETQVMSQKATTEAIGDLYDAEIPVGEITEGYFVYSSGNTFENPTSCVTDFVPVAEGYTLRIEKCFLEDGRSICAYDENKIIVACVATASMETEVTYTIPSGVCYIRVTGSTGVAPKITKINHPINDDIDALNKRIDKANEGVSAVEDKVDELYDVYVPVGDIKENAYITPSGTELEITVLPLCVTDFIEVVEGLVLHIKNCNIEGNSSVCAYDESKQFVECIASNSASTEVTYTVPQGVRYIRITASMDKTPSIEKVEYPINKELAAVERNVSAVKEHVSAVEEKVDGIVSSDITPYRVEAAKFINASGALVPDSISTSYFIEVVGNHTVAISGVNTEYSRALCVYDTNGNFKECVGTNNSNKEYTVSVDEDSIIGFSVTTGTFSAKYTDRFVVNDDVLALGERLGAHKENEYVGNYLPKTRHIDKQSMSNGYLHNNGTTVLSPTTTYYFYTPYIDIVGGQEFTVKNIMPTAGKALHYYDKDKKCIGGEPHSSGDTNFSELTFIAPRGARYIRFSMQLPYTGDVYVIYSNDVQRNAQEKSTLDGWFSDAHNKIPVLFGDYVKKPLITIIDDDTVNTTQVQTFRDVCTANGIKGTLACITKQAVNSSDLKNLLLNVEKEGFHICLHCHEHTNGFQEVNFDLATAEENILQGCKEMEQLGFTDWKFWVTPGGESFPALQNLVRKWGFECVITSNTNQEVETTEAKYGRWNICRPSWLTSEEETDALFDSTGHLTLKGWKAYADETVAKGGWLLVNTHMYGGGEAQGWDDPSSKSRIEFAEFVAYAKSIGCTFTTLNEAWRIKAPIYKFYELFI